MLRRIFFANFMFRSDGGADSNRLSVACVDGDNVQRRSFTWMSVSGQWLCEEDEEESPPLNEEEDLDFDLVRFGRRRSKMDLGPRDEEDEEEEEEEEEEELFVVEVEEKMDRWLIFVVPAPLAVLPRVCQSTRVLAALNCSKEISTNYYCQVILQNP